MFMALKNQSSTIYKHISHSPALKPETPLNDSKMCVCFQTKWACCGCSKNVRWERCKRTRYNVQGIYGFEPEDCPDYVKVERYLSHPAMCDKCWRETWRNDERRKKKACVVM
jgi:hypothetical protein